jgi:hypothetical protein
MAASREQVLLAAFTALESAHFYSAFLPSVMTIRKFAEDPDALQALRQGEVLATGATVALGWVISELIASPLPLVFALGMAVVMVTIYEWAIRQRWGSAALASAGLTAATLLPGVPPLP